MAGQPWSGHHAAWQEEYVELASGRTRMLVLEPDAGPHLCEGRRVQVATLLHSHGMMVPCDVENHAQGVPQMLLQLAQPILDGEGGVCLWRLIRYDLRGEGKSSDGASFEEQTWAAQGRDLRELVQLVRRRYYPCSLWDEAARGPCGGGAATFRPANGRACMVLSGLSMGTGAALHAFVEEQTVADGLLLLLPPPAYGHNPLSAVSFKKLADMVLAKGRDPALAILLTLIAEGEEAGRVQHTSAGFPARAMASYLRRWDARRLNQSLHAGSVSRLPSQERVAAALATRPVPVLLLALEADKNHPLAVAQALAALLPPQSRVPAPEAPLNAPSLAVNARMAGLSSPGTVAAGRRLLQAAAERQGFCGAPADAEEERGGCSVS